MMKKVHDPISEEFRNEERPFEHEADPKANYIKKQEDLDTLDHWNDIQETP